MTRYFNALRRLDFKTLRLNMKDEAIFHEFVCIHLVSATRVVRPDIVRLLFQQIHNRAKLHKILLFCDPASADETLTKTALEWAVENNDRLCTTEILHQEFECHKTSKSEGLNCLRQQLTGDELLTWTIETFTTFYDKTWAQKSLIPLFGLFPLLMSIATFVYDYYSDIELTLEYYYRAFMPYLYDDDISTQTNLLQQQQLPLSSPSNLGKHCCWSGILGKWMCKAWLSWSVRKSLRTATMD